MKHGTAILSRGCSAAARRGVGRDFLGLFSGLGTALWAAAVLAWSDVSVEAQISREYQIKAVFLFNFAQFTEWPANAFPSEKSPIIIGIVGPDPFGAALQETIHGETIQGRPLQIEHYARAADIKTCHVLYITQPEIRHADEIVKSIEGKPILTVADSDTPSSATAMIRFVLENNKLHFRVNLEAARGANISLSSKLLRLADPQSGGKAP